MLDTIEQSPILPLNVLQAQMGFFKGDILTIIDASFSDERQCKAVKDVISKSFRDRMSWLSELSRGQNSSSTLENLDGTVTTRTLDTE